MFQRTPTWVCAARYQSLIRGVGLCAMLLTVGGSHGRLPKSDRTDICAYVLCKMSVLRRLAWIHPQKTFFSESCSRTRVLEPYRQTWTICGAGNSGTESIQQPRASVIFLDGWPLGPLKPLPHVWHGMSRHDFCSRILQGYMVYSTRLAGHPLGNHRHSLKMRAP